MDRKKKELLEIFFQYKRLKKRKHQHRQNVIQETGLHGTGSITIPTDATIPTIYLRQLQTAYPPMGKWVADNTPIYDQWEQHLRTFRLSDQRHKHYPTMVIDEKQLQLDIDSTQGVVIRDEVTKEVVGVVLRNYAKNKENLD